MYAIGTLTRYCPDKSLIFRGCPLIKRVDAHQERMREKGLKEKEREEPTHLIELARFTHASRVTKDSSCMR